MKRCPLFGDCWIDTAMVKVVSTTGKPQIDFFFMLPSSFSDVVSLKVFTYKEALHVLCLGILFVYSLPAVM